MRKVIKKIIIRKKPKKSEMVQPGIIDAS